VDIFTGGAVNYSFGAAPAVEIDQWYLVAVDLSRAIQFRLSFDIRNAGPAGSKYRMKYFNGSTYVDLSSVAGAGDLSANVVTVATTSWITIAVAARTDTVKLVLFTVGGNSSAVWQVAFMRMEYR